MELGTGWLLLLLLVALLVYGGDLPDVARSLGRTIGEFKRAFQETKDAVGKEIQTGLDLEIDETKRPRETQRVTPTPETPPTPAPPDVAKEDISKPDYDPSRHEHPN